jgi:transposase-like protein
MDLELSPSQWAGLEAAAVGERRVRIWRRYRAVLLVAEGETPAAVPAALGCSPSSVYGWVGTWRRAGLAGLRGRHHGGVAPLAERAGVMRYRTMRSDEREVARYVFGHSLPGFDQIRLTNLAGFGGRPFAVPAQGGGRCCTWAAATCARAASGTCRC